MGFSQNAWKGERNKTKHKETKKWVAQKGLATDLVSTLHDVHFRINKAWVVFGIEVSVDLEQTCVGWMDRE